MSWTPDRPLAGRRSPLVRGDRVRLRCAVGDRTGALGRGVRDARLRRDARGRACRSGRRGWAPPAGRMCSTSVRTERSRRSSSTCPRCRRCAGGLRTTSGTSPQLLPYLPTHTKGNPPGPLVAMHLLGLTTPGRLAAACIIVGSLVTPLTYALGRSLGSRAGSGGTTSGAVGWRARSMRSAAVESPRRSRRSRRACWSTAFTSFDFVFAAMAAAVAWLLVSRRGRCRRARLRRGRSRRVLLMGAARDPGVGGGRRLRPRRPRPGVPARCRRARPGSLAVTLRARRRLGL